MPITHDYLTTADIFHINNSEEEVGLFEEAMKSLPELQQFAATPVTKTQYETLVRTALPTVNFRESNTGRAYSRSTLATKQVICKYLDASFCVDNKVIAECEWGLDYVMTMEALAHLEAAFQKIAEQTWYGVNADATGFAGIGTLLAHFDSPMVVDAGGTAANTGSSVFAVKSSPTEVAYAWGMAGKISITSPREIETTDSEGGKYWGQAMPINGHVGLQIPSTQCVGRIANLTAEDGKGLTQDLIALLLEKFPAGKMLTALYMSMRSLGQLRRSLDNSNFTGKELGYPTEIFGIPIYVTEAIRNNESLLTATPATV